MTLNTTGNKTEERNLTSGRGEGPNPIDIHVGKRLLAQRTLQGFTQGKLGDLVGLTYQQIQKYERGANRVSASKIYQLANHLGVGVTYFFDDMPDVITEAGNLKDVNIDELLNEYDEVHCRQSLELNRVFSKMKSPFMRKRFLDLASAFVNDQNEGE